MFSVAWWNVCEIVNVIQQVQLYVSLKPKLCISVDHMNSGIQDVHLPVHY